MVVKIEGKPTNWVAAVVVVAVWLSFAALAALIAYRAFRGT